MRFSIFSLAAVAAIFVAACSTTGGLGGPLGGDAGTGGFGRPQSVTTPSSKGSASPTASPSSSSEPLSGAVAVAGATARLAFDGSAADPQRAPRILVLTFALKNGLKSSIGLRKIFVSGSGDFRPFSGAMNPTFLGNQKNGSDKSKDSGSAAASPSPAVAAISVDVGSGRQSDAHVVAIPLPDAIASHKQATIDFLPAKGTALASVTLDVPAADISSTSLNEKSPKGAVSIDSVDIGAIEMAGAGLHYRMTFALTNAGTTAAPIVSISVTPPKSTATKVALPFLLQGRTTTSFITIVLPYGGKALPNGKYAVTASGSAGSIASGSGNLL